jgi:ribosomal protein S18 acetylase RimI-like enzyme
MIIRKAKMLDLDSLKILLEQLGYDKPTEWFYKKLENYLNSNLYEILVAEDDGKILGFVMLIIYESFVFDKCMHIETLIIDKNCRGKGIGGKLMAGAEEIAKKEYCNLIELITLNKRKKDGTHNFYEKLGYRDQERTDLTYFSKLFTDTKE